MSTTNTTTSTSRPPSRLRDRSRELFRALGSGTVLLGVLLLTGCGKEATPDEVSHEFWAGVLDRDRNRVSKTVRREQRGQIELDQLPQISGAEPGRIIIDGDSAIVETRIGLSGATADAPLSVQTYLSRDPSGWRVEYERTTAQLTARAELEEIVEKVRVIGETLAGELNRGVESLKQKLPAIEQDLKRELDRIEKDIRDQLPEIRRRLDEFTRQLEDALKQPPAQEPPPTTDEPIST